MEKNARKRSTDPVQEKLRQDKADWNREVSTFIEAMNQFKKLMNGFPSAIYKQRSRIVDPIPANPTTIISSLVGDFQEVVNKGNSVIEQQLNYSKNRRKKRPKQPKPLAQQPPTAVAPIEPAETPAPAHDLSKQLAPGIASYDYQLISQASNPLSRFFARLLAPGIGTSEGARVRKYRVSLLNAAVQMYRDLKGMQRAIVGSGPQSIFLASKILDKVEDNWVFLSSGFNTYVETLPGGAKDTGDKIKPPVDKATPAQVVPNPAGAEVLTDSTVIEALKAVQDIRAKALNYLGHAKLFGDALKFQSAAPDKKLQTARQLLDDYHRALGILAVKKKLTGIPTSFADVDTMQPATPAAQPTIAQSSQDQIQVLAQAFLKKLRHQLSPFDKTSSFRLDIYKMAEQNKKLLDKVMNVLEDGMDQEALSVLLEEVGENMKKVRALMRGLSSTIRGQGYQPQFMDLLDKGRMGDHGVELDPKQQERLSKLLQQKQMRELVKMYGRK